jgi:hypothetical protein
MAPKKNEDAQEGDIVVDLMGKCIEGLKMNWVSYLINQLEKYYHEA